MSQKKWAFFDLSGTVLQEDSCTLIPMMPEVLRELARQGWSVSIVSNYTHRRCEQFLNDSGLDVRVQIHSSAGFSKGAIVARVLHSEGGVDNIFVDDAPENLESVMKLCGHRVRVIGFAGSREYEPELVRWCQENDAELAKSPLELCKLLCLAIEPGGAGR